MADRTVHAAYDGMEIVRYDRAGKWYFEPTDQSLKRQKVSLMDAAEQAVWGVDYANGEVFFDKPGGNTFDMRVRGIWRERAARGL